MKVRAIAAWHVQYLAADDDGATMMEYALIVSLASIAISAALPELRDSLMEMFQLAADGLTNAASGAQTP